MKKLTYIAIALILWGCKNETNLSTQVESSVSKDTIAQKKTQQHWIFDSIKGSQLHFKGQHVFDTHLYDLNFIGQLSAENKSPYLIFSGRSCTECDENISIYIHSPSDGDIVTEYGQNRYPFPGVMRERETGKEIFTSTAYFGQVLDTVRGVIWYNTITNEDGKQYSTLLTYIDHDTLTTVVFKNIKGLATTQNLSAKGRCKTIEGIEYLSEP